MIDIRSVFYITYIGKKIDFSKINYYLKNLLIGVRIYRYIMAIFSNKFYATLYNASLTLSVDITEKKCSQTQLKINLRDLLAMASFVYLSTFSLIRRQFC